METSQLQIEIYTSFITEIKRFYLSTCLEVPLVDEMIMYSNSVFIAEVHADLIFGDF